MCGIAGVIGEASGAIEITHLILDAMDHRGPDQHGIWHSPSAPAVLGHRRLSILDLSEAGRQPMTDPISGCVIVYNGECYNFMELRTELEQRSRKFVSHSDTEVILAAYAEWGENSISRLRGMFAFAIWDPRDETLLLVRDRVGIKPLYITTQGHSTFFASELRSLLASGRVPREIDPAGVQSYLWHGFVPGPGTIVRNVHLVEPGSMLRLDRNGKVLKQRTYWQLGYDTPFTPQPSSVKEARETLEQTVSMHMVSDVPLAVFLSGGVDSSVVSALAQRNSKDRIVTFNVRFEEKAYDESAHAREVAKILGTDHHEITLTENSFSSALPDAMDAIDQPTFDAINTYFVSRAVREQGVKVALAGTGGDELFGGYRSFIDIPKAMHGSRALNYFPGRLAHLASHVVEAFEAHSAGEVLPQTRFGKFRDVVNTRGDLVGLYQVSYGLFSQQLLDSMCLLGTEGLSWGLQTSRVKQLQEMVRNRSVLSATSLLELASFTGERLLRDTDAASMAVSLEVRVPLLDHVFIESIFRVADADRFKPAGRKKLLQHFVSDQLDPKIFDRKKSGFVLPLDRWCRQQLAGRLTDAFQDINLAHSIGLDAETVGRLWRAFTKGSKGLYWSRVWSLFILLDWCKRHGVYLANPKHST